MSTEPKADNWREGHPTDVDAAFVTRGGATASPRVSIQMALEDRVMIGRWVASGDIGLWWIEGSDGAAIRPEGVRFWQPLPEPRK